MMVLTWLPVSNCVLALPLPTSTSSSGHLPTSDSKNLLQVMVLEPFASARIAWLSVTEEASFPEVVHY